jgi:hypothetical protein
VAVPPNLRRDAAELESTVGPKVELVGAPTGPQVFVILKEVVLPDGAFAVAKSDVLYVTDEQYPYSAMDMFWTEVEVLLPDGGVPGGAESIETYVDRTWRRFSWHRNGVWNPKRNGLLDHYEFMQARFAMEAQT